MPSLSTIKIIERALIALDPEELEMQLSERYGRVRARTLELVAGLTEADCGLQSMPDASPAKWHLAHTTWFFEEMILARNSDFKKFDENFSALFNSYYNALGKPFPRESRGLISQPNLNEVKKYREFVDLEMKHLFATHSLSEETVKLIELGLNHEQQHQELICTDILNAFSFNPFSPKVFSHNALTTKQVSNSKWLKFTKKIYWIGANSDSFHFDNEAPKHEVLIHDFEINSELVSNAEYLEFVQTGGYHTPTHWLSDGWAWIQNEKIEAPLYWRNRTAGWTEFSLTGEHSLALEKPVIHLSYYEADAYARWKGCRLPRENEWEVAAEANPSFLLQLWQWTQTAYAAYPGFRAFEGLAEEYNAKFMCNQMVLRGGSFATPSDHIRVTYRNFFPPTARWQFSGLRLARG